MFRSSAGRWIDLIDSTTPMSAYDWRAAALAGVVAGVAATALQIVLWLLFTDAFPAILFRDTRLAAAIVLGPSVLAPAGSLPWPVLLVAALVHFTLSIVYG